MCAKDYQTLSQKPVFSVAIKFWVSAILVPNFITRVVVSSGFISGTGWSFASCEFLRQILVTGRLKAQSECVQKIMTHCIRICVLVQQPNFGGAP